MKAKEYRDAVNSGKMKAPKASDWMTYWSKYAAATGRATPAAYRAFINKGWSK